MPVEKRRQKCLSYRKSTEGLSTPLGTYVHVLCIPFEMDEMGVL